MTAGLILLAGACGAGSDAPVSAPPSDPTSAAGSSSSPTNSPTQPPSKPTVAPATGPLITSSAATVNTPDDYTRKPTSTSLGGNLSGIDARYNVALTDDDTEIDGSTLDKVAKVSQRFSVIRPPLARQPDTTMAGLPVYHLAGRDSNFGRWAEEFGMYVDGHFIRVTISTPLDLPQTERDTIAAPVLASFKLTG